MDKDSTANTSSSSNGFIGLVKEKSKSNFQAQDDYGTLRTPSGAEKEKWNYHTNDHCEAFHTSSPPRVNSITLNLVSKYNLGKCIDASPLVLFNQSNSDGLVMIGSHSRAFVALYFSPWALMGGERSTKGRYIDGRKSDDDVLEWRVETDDRLESSAALTEDGQYCVFGKLATVCPSFTFYMILLI